LNIKNEIWCNDALAMDFSSTCFVVQI